MVIKARRQGNSVVLTVPKKINVPVNTKFKVVQQKNGDIVYKPLKKVGYDLWSDASYNDFDYKVELEQEYQDLGYNPREVKQVGKEIVDNNSRVS